MSSRRTLILIAAIAVGALAAFAIFNYVGGIEDRANDNARRVRVIRVAQDIPRGLDGVTARDQGYLDLDAEIPAEFLPRTAVQDVETILTKIAVADLAAGQVLVENMFVDPVNAQVTAARRIETGRVAITVSVDQIRGVAGLVVPGDFVNMMAIPSNSICDEGGGAEGATPTPEEATGPVAIFCSPARMVFQEVQVLFVDRSPIPLPGEATTTNADGSTATPTNTGLLTLSVPPAAAQMIASVGSDQWYLTLLPNDYVPAPVPPFDPVTATLPGEDPAILTPYGPEGFTPDETP